MNSKVLSNARAIYRFISKAIGVRVRTKWYVDVTNGDDTYPGNSPDLPFATIGAVLNVAAAGDYVQIGQGTYDEAISVAAGLAGIEFFCEPGVRLVNTTPGTVLSIAAPYVRWTGGTIIQAGQVGLLLTGIDFLGVNMVVQDCTISYDIGANRPIFRNCVSENHSQTGFETVSASGIFDNCSAHGQAAARGFYLSGAGADYNLFYRCNSINNSGGAYETVAGADGNVFAWCNQSELCGGPTDAGANNSWIGHGEESQIAVGNTQAQDLADIHTLVGAQILPPLDCWSVAQLTVTIPAAGANQALPDVTVADLPAGAVVDYAIALFKFWRVDETSSGANMLSGAQVIQVRDDSPSAYINAINMIDDMYPLAADEQLFGDVVIGAIDVSGTVDGNDTYNFQWTSAVCDAASMVFRIVQTGLRIWYHVP